MTTPNTTPVAPVVPAVAAVAAAAPADDFDSVFAEITKLDDEGKEPDATKPAVAVADPAVAAVADPAAVAVVAAAVDPAAVADPAVAAAAVVKPAAAVEPAAVVEPAPELTAALAKIAELEAAAKKPAAAVEEPKKDEPAPVAIKWYEHSAEETALLATYDKEWPEQSAAEAIRVKAAVFNAVQYIFAEVKKTYGPQMERFESIADVMGESMALQHLKGDHADYDTIYANVVEWVDTLSPAFKKGAKDILKEGSPEEVSQLVAEYKKAHPAVAVPAAVVATVAPGKTELSPAAKKAASKLTVVDSKRTAPVTAVDPNDFDGAWAEATAAGK